MKNGFMRSIMAAILLGLLIVILMPNYGRNASLEDIEAEQEQLLGGWAVEIPTYKPGPGEDPIPLGMELPEEYEWPEKPGVQFLYTPEIFNAINSEEVFQVEDTGFWLFRAGNYFFLIEPTGPVGPVFQCVSALGRGEVYGVTQNCLLFLEKGSIIACEGNCESGATHRYDKLPETERATVKRANPDVIALAKNAQISDFEKVAEYERDGDVVEIMFPDAMSSRPERLVLNNPESWEFPDGCCFFIQSMKGSIQEAVFAGALDGIMQVICVPFEGKLIKVDERGIYYYRDGEEFFKSLYPIRMGNDYIYAELPATLVDEIGEAFPSVIKDHGGKAKPSPNTSLFE